MIKRLLPLFLLATSAHAGDLGAYYYNREGVRALGRKDGVGAYRAFTRGLGEDPMNPALQLNLAATFEQNEEFEKAAAVYRGLLARLPKDEPRRFEVLFNLGNVLAAANNTPDAVASYQEALELKPDSIEVKTNLEMLFAGGKGGDGKSSSQEKDEKQDKDDKQDKRTNQQKREDAQKDQKPEKKDGDKPKPKPFNSDNLTAEDVKRILDEIKNQEQSIRAEEYDKNPKDTPRGGKDW